MMLFCGYFYVEGKRVIIFTVQFLAQGRKDLSTHTDFFFFCNSQHFQWYTRKNSVTFYLAREILLETHTLIIFYKLSLRVEKHSFDVKNELFLG